MDVRLLLEELLHEISETETELAKKKEFVEFLRARIAPLETTYKVQTIHTRSSARSAFESAVQRARTATERALMAAPDTKVTLRGRVARVVAGYNGGEFGATEVLSDLKDSGFEIPDENRSRITTILSRMVDSGELVKSYTGSGSVPNRYMTTPQGINPDAKDDDEL